MEISSYANSPEGQVHVRGEMWTAEAEDRTPIREGDRIVVVGVDGLRLRLLNVGGA